MIHQPIMCYRMDQRWPSGPDKGTLSQRKHFQIRAIHNQNRTVASGCVVHTRHRRTRLSGCMGLKLTLLTALPVRQGCILEHEKRCFFLICTKALWRLVNSQGKGLRVEKAMSLPPN